MIIDLILDRKDGQPYSPDAFAKRMERYGSLYAECFLNSFDTDDEPSAKAALCDYVLANDYPQTLIPFIRSCRWL